MYVFDGIKGVKKINKFWGQKHKQPNATLKKKTILSLAFDQLHVLQVGTQSCNVDEASSRSLYVNFL